jgi:hypothetical protein
MKERRRPAASDLAFTRDRHLLMRTSATADVRWRAMRASSEMGEVRTYTQKENARAGFSGAFVWAQLITMNN